MFFMHGTLKFYFFLRKLEITIYMAMAVRKTLYVYNFHNSLRKNIDYRFIGKRN